MKCNKLQIKIRTKLIQAINNLKCRFAKDKELSYINTENSINQKPQKNN